ncbi:MAG: hypothetical protein ACRDJY_08050 [Thermoleophilaceae bacterium]
MQLTIVEDSPAAPSPPDASDPSATVWRDDDETIIALGQTLGGRHWVHVPGLGAFSFSREASDITAVPDPGADPALIEDAYRRTVLPLALQALGHEVLHASAVRTPAGVVPLCAVSGTGKSTVAAALTRRGHDLWADDAVCFEVAESSVEVLPLPFSLRLLPASAALFAEDGIDRGLRSPEGREPLAGVFVLERSDGGRAELERLDSATAFTAVLTHGYCFSMSDRERNEAMVRNYLELVARVPVFRLTFPDGLDGLDGLLDMIEGAIQ